MLVREKVDQAKRLLDEFGIDCWLTFVRESAINGDPSLTFLVAADVTWHSAFIIAKDGSTRAIVGQFDQKTVEDAGAYDQVTGFVEGIKQPLLETLRALDPQTIAINYSVESEVCDGLTHGMYLTLHGFLTEIGFQDRLMSAEKIISALRERKSQTELERIRGAIRKTEEIFRNVTQYIRPGKSEQDVASFMQGEVERLGYALAWEKSMCPAVFSGPETAGAHYAPTERKIERGHVLNMDFGIKSEDYCSDLQRTFYIPNKGEKGAPPEVQKGFATIIGSIEAARRAMKPGVPGHDIDTVTRLTVPGRGVVTIEEMVVVTETGAEWLSTPQQELIVVR
jgi:Xaa-Pro aminopeptidase